jgi:hypothetical protein
VTFFLVSRLLSIYFGKLRYFCRDWPILHGVTIDRSIQ